MSVITTAAFPKALRPGVFAFTQMNYNEHKPFWPSLFSEQKSNMSYEELVSGNGFGLLSSKNEGGKIQYQSESQGNTTRATHVVYAGGYIITLEEARYGMYEKVGMRRGARLAKAARRTKDTVAANIFNRAFNSSYTFGDGKELCATDHPSVAGTYQNELTVAADMSETSIEDLCTLIRKATDNVGNKMDLRPMKLVYAPDEMFNATRILDSERQSGTANNDTNAMKSRGAIPMHFDNPYFEDSDAFFILTDVVDTDGLIAFESIPFTTGIENESDTLNEKHYVYEAYSFTCGDPRKVYGCPGA